MYFFNSLQWVSVHRKDWKQGRSKNFSKEGGGVEATMFHTHGAHGTYQLWCWHPYSDSLKDTSQFFRLRSQRGGGGVEDRGGGGGGI